MSPATNFGAASHAEILGRRILLAPIFDFRWEVVLATGTRAERRREAKKRRQFRLDVIRQRNSKRQRRDRSRSHRAYVATIEPCVCGAVRVEHESGAAPCASFSLDRRAWDRVLKRAHRRWDPPCLARLEDGRSCGVSADHQPTDECRRFVERKRPRAPQHARDAEMPRAFDGCLSPTQEARLANARSRCERCGGGAAIVIEHVPCGRNFSVRYGCNTRLCERCGRRYRNKKRQRFDPIKRLPSLRGARLKFVTLTFENLASGPADDPSDTRPRWEDADACKRWFEERTAMLREFFPTREKDITDRSFMLAKGYVAVWEVTRGRDGRWHPHLHVLLWCDYIHVAEMRRKWRVVSGATQTPQVDVKGVRDGGRGVDYLLKYLSKPWPDVPDDIQVAALYRTRRITSVGQFYGAKFTHLSALCMMPSEKIRWALTCPHCGPVTPADVGQDVVSLEACARPWRAPPGDWATRKIISLLDYAEKDTPAPPAVMSAFWWNGQPATTIDAAGILSRVPPQEVRLTFGPGLSHAEFVRIESETIPDES